LPKINGTENGIWRRLMPIPFNILIDESQKDVNLVDKLRQEASGILNWAVEGYRIYHAEGLVEPSSVKAAKIEYQINSNNIQLFLIDCIREEPGNNIKSSDLYQHYRKWCESNGIKDIKPIQAFGRFVNKLHKSVSMRDGNHYPGITLVGPEH